MTPARSKAGLIGGAYTNSGYIIHLTLAVITEPKQVSLKPFDILKTGASKYIPSKALRALFLCAPSGIEEGFSLSFARGVATFRR